MRQLQWLGLLVVLGWCGGALAQTPTAAAEPNESAEAPGLPHDISGIVTSIDASGAKLTVQTRSSRVVQVDATAALQTHRANIPPVGHAVYAHGTYDAKGVLQAATIQREKDSAVGWRADR
jgi:hypothetical protein